MQTKTNGLLSGIYKEMGNCPDSLGSVILVVEAPNKVNEED